MFIKSLKLKNFRSFGRGADGTGTTIDLNQDLTALIGRNGSGKTSILEALNFLIGQDYLSTRINEKDFHKDANGTKEEDAIVIEGETAEPFFIEIDVISDKGVSSTVVVPCRGVRLFIKRREHAEKVLDDPYRIEKTVIPITGSIDDSIYQSQEFSKSYPIVSLEEIDSEINDLDTAKEVIKDLLKGIATEIQHLDRYYQVKFKLKAKNDVRVASFPSYSLYYNPSRIKGLPKSYYLSKNRDSDVTGNYSLIAKILTDLHWRYKKKHSSSENTISDEYDILAGSLRGIVDEKGVLINKINEKVRSICTDDIDFQIDFIDIDQPYKSAFLAKKDGSKLLMPDNLGSGFNILIAYALFASVADREKTPIVLIIDEPELHLHSDWQRRMYDVFVGQKDLQIVYSTQSENFISLKHWRQIRAINDFQIFPVEETLQEQVASTDGQTGTRSDYLDDYASRNLQISTILRENLELFFTQKCILVEGPSDKYALPKLLKLAGCDMENYSVSIIPAWGKAKIRYYQMICKCFGKAFYTVFDHDKEENENTYIEANSEAERITQFSTSFEKKLGITTNDDKFQKLVKIIDSITDLTSLDEEIQTGVKDIKSFLENED